MMMNMICMGFGFGFEFGFGFRFGLSEMRREEKRREEKKREEKKKIETQLDLKNRRSFVFHFDMKYNNNKFKKF